MRAISLLLIVASVAWSDVRTRNVSAGSLVEVFPDNPSAVIVQEPIGLETKSYLLQGGKQAIVFCAGQHKRIVLTVFSNGEVLPNVDQLIFIVGDNPDPNPGPDPEPDDPELHDLVKYIRDNGRKAGIPKATAQALAGNYEAVQSKIAAVSTMTTEQARRELIELNQETVKTHSMPDAARPVSARLSEYLNKHGTDVKKTGQIFGMIAEGLKLI